MTLAELELCLAEAAIRHGPVRLTVAHREGAWIASLHVDRNVLWASLIARKVATSLEDAIRFVVGPTRRTISPRTIDGKEKPTAEIDQPQEQRK